MRIKNIYRLECVLWVIVGFSLLIAYVFENDIFLTVSVLALVTILVIWIFFWKCPRCGKHLGRDIGTYCKNCGNKLDT